MPDPLTLTDAWCAMRDHIGTLSPLTDPDELGIAADTFLSLTNAIGDIADPDAELMRDDLPPIIAGPDPSSWFPRGGDGCALPAILVAWIHANVARPSWVPADA